MSLFIMSKPCITSVIAFISLILIFTIIYISSQMKMNYFSVQTFQYYKKNNQLDRSSIRICCLILTAPINLLTRARAINATWGPRCDRYFFITEYPKEKMTLEAKDFANNIPIAPITNITPGYEHLTQKSTLAFLFAYKNYFNDFDWFVKADDDTYLIVEYLKDFLSKQNTSEPVTFGYNFKVNVPKGYHSGGASYVLSRESLRRFYQTHQDPNTQCRKDSGSEDVEIARCLRLQGVYPGKSLDELKRELFHPLTFPHHFRGNIPDWLKIYAENPVQAHYNCCSDRSISFHYVGPDEIYLMDFLIYKLQSIEIIKSERKK